MLLPANFSGVPQEQLHHHFRNVCLDFKKTLKTSKDVIEIQMQLDKFYNLCRHMDWHEKNSDVFHKNSAEKAINKVMRDCGRYIQELEGEQSSISAQDIINDITTVENLAKP